jgi:hypothetical protein
MYSGPSPFSRFASVTSPQISQRVTKKIATKNTHPTKYNNHLGWEFDLDLIK